MHLKLFFLSWIACFHCSVTKSCQTLWDSMDCSTPGFPVHHKSGVCSHSCPFNQWCYPIVSSCVAPFSSCSQSFPASGSFPISRIFASGGQRIGVSASASILPMSIQDWFPLGLTGLISLQSKELSRVFSNTIVQKHQFFGIQLSLWSNSHIHTWLLEKSELWLDEPKGGKLLRWPKNHLDFSVTLYGNQDFGPIQYFFIYEISTCTCWEYLVAVPVTSG